ncbi:MAG TPA: hypothetical protein PKH93_02110 [Chitinophagales bacterium]|jgi:hypothetical protein|nr:hypothetical protein [Chitinophagales bacterium]
MDTIELKKIYCIDGLVSEQPASLKGSLSKVKTTSGNVTLTKGELRKKQIEFYEFFINGKPLSQILTEFSKLKSPLLDDLVGVLGFFPNKQLELNTIKKLLLKQITEQDIRNVFPKNLYVENEIESYKEELAREDIIIYCCVLCGDPDCGGFRIKVHKENDQFVWTYNDEGNILQFHFDIYQYFNTFNMYRKTVEKLL